MVGLGTRNMSHDDDTVILLEDEYDTRELRNPLIRKYCFIRKVFTINSFFPAATKLWEQYYGPDTKIPYTALEQWYKDLRLIHSSSAGVGKILSACVLRIVHDVRRKFPYRIPRLSSMGVEVIQDESLATREVRLIDARNRGHDLNTIKGAMASRTSSLQLSLSQYILDSIGGHKWSPENSAYPFQAFEVILFQMAPEVKKLLGRLNRGTVETRFVEFLYQICDDDVDFMLGVFTALGPNLYSYPLRVLQLMDSRNLFRKNSIILTILASSAASWNRRKHFTPLEIIPAGVGRYFQYDQICGEPISSPADHTNVNWNRGSSPVVQGILKERPSTAAFGRSFKSETTVKATRLVPPNEEGGRERDESRVTSWVESQQAGKKTSVKAENGVATLHTPEVVPGNIPNLPFAHWSNAVTEALTTFGFPPASTTLMQQVFQLNLNSPQIPTSFMEGLLTGICVTLRTQQENKENQRKVVQHPKTGKQSAKKKDNLTTTVTVPPSPPRDPRLKRKRPSADEERPKTPPGSPPKLIRPSNEVILRELARLDAILGPRKPKGKEAERKIQPQKGPPPTPTPEITIKVEEEAEMGFQPRYPRWRSAMSITPPRSFSPVVFDYGHINHRPVRHIMPKEKEEKL